MQNGVVLAGKYRLESLLGRGGMGSVWRATHLALHAPVAIKLIDASIVTNPEALARFVREARAAAGLRSPHVVQILDHGLDEVTHTPFIAMELLEGESLGKRLERVGRLSPAETARFVSHVARALTRAHEAGVVHRDLKPDNVFLVENDDEEIAKILDFGIAKSHAALGIDAATRTGAVMGTPYYMSPEQISGARDVDHRTDVWALGVIACECLTGARPFDADSMGGLTLKICVEPLPLPSRLAPVPAGFDAWFMRATARPLAERFQSARELGDELRRVVEHGGALVGSAGFAAASSPPPPLRTLDSLSRTADSDGSLAPAKRRRGGFVALGLGLVTLGGLLAFAVLRFRPAPAAELTTAAEPVATAPATAPVAPTVPVTPTAAAPPSEVAPRPVVTPAPSTATPEANAAGTKAKKSPNAKHRAPPPSEPSRPARPASTQATAPNLGVLDERR